MELFSEKEEEENKKRKEVSSSVQPSASIVRNN